MIKELNSRKKKVEFLKGLISGKRKIIEMRPFIPWLVFETYPERPEIYIDAKTKQEYSEEDLDKLKKRGYNFFIYHVPIMDEYDSPEVD